MEPTSHAQAPSSSTSWRSPRAASGSQAWEPARTSVSKDEESKEEEDESLDNDLLAPGERGRMLSQATNNNIETVLNGLRAQQKEGEPLIKLEEVLAEELNKREWPCEAPGFENAPWRILPQTRAFRSPVLERIFGEIVGNEPVQDLQQGAAITKNELLETLQSKRVLPFYVGGFIRDLLQGNRPNDLDMSFVCSATDLQEFAQWAESQSWKYSVKGKKRVLFAQAALDPAYKGELFGGEASGLEEAVTQLHYMNFGKQDFDEEGFEDGVEGKVFGNPGPDGMHVPGWSERDFCCNALIYDPHLHLLIDPTGFGVTDAFAMTLRIPADATGNWQRDSWLHDPKRFARIPRWFKSVARGYTPAHGEYGEAQLRWVVAQVEANLQDQDLHIAFGGHLKKLTEEKKEECKRLVKEACIECGKDEAWFDSQVHPWLSTCHTLKAKPPQMWACIRCTFAGNTEADDECTVCGARRPTNAEREEARRAGEREREQRREQRQRQREERERRSAAGEVAIEMQPMGVEVEAGAVEAAFQVANPLHVDDDEGGAGGEKQLEDIEALREWIPPGVHNYIDSDRITAEGLREFFEANAPDSVGMVDHMLSNNNGPGGHRYLREILEEECPPSDGHTPLRREQQVDSTMVLRRHAQFVRDGIANLKSKKLSTGQYFCWSLSPPAVTIVTKDGQHHSLRGPVEGNGTWGPWHQLGDVKRAFEQQQGLVEAQTDYFLLPTSDSAYTETRTAQNEAADETLLYHCMVPGADVRFRLIACQVLPVPEPCTVTVQTMSGEEHTLEMQTTNTVADVKDEYEAKVGGPSRWVQEYWLAEEEEPSADDRRLLSCPVHTFMLAVGDEAEAEKKQAQEQAKADLKAELNKPDARAFETELVVDAFPLTFWEQLFYHGCIRFVRCWQCSCACSCCFGVIIGPAMFVWLCIVAVSGAGAGIRGIGFGGACALAGFALAVGAFPGGFACCVYGGGVAKNAADERAGLASWAFLSPLYASDDEDLFEGAVGLVKEGRERRSVKAGWVVREGEAHRQERKRWRGQGFDIESGGIRGVLVWTALFWVIGWGTGSMVFAGARCVYSGDHSHNSLCGPAGYGGGVAMLAIGGVGPYLLMWLFVFGIIAVCGRVCFGKNGGKSMEAVFGESEVVLVALVVFLYPAAWLLGAGYVCVSLGGESGMCGVGGYDGGVAMLAIGGLMAMGLAYICARPPSAEVSQILFVGIAGVGVSSASLYLTIAGALCVHSDGAEKCGPAGYGGGVAMVVIGSIGPYLLMWLFVYGITAFCGNEGVFFPLLVLLYPTAWLLGAGYVCVSSGGESGMCGVGGYDGGVAMLAIGGLMAVGLVCLRCFARELWHELTVFF